MLFASKSKWHMLLLLSPSHRFKIPFSSLLSSFFFIIHQSLESDFFIFHPRVFHRQKCKPDFPATKNCSLSNSSYKHVRVGWRPFTGPSSSRNTTTCRWADGGCNWATDIVYKYSSISALIHTPTFSECIIRLIFRDAAPTEIGVFEHAGSGSNNNQKQ